MADVNRRYFDSLMLDKDLSLRALAQRMGMSHSQLSLTFAGHRKLQLDEAAQLASIFSEPIERIIEAIGVPVRMGGSVRISVIGALTGDGTVTLNPPGVIERTGAPEGIPENGIAVQCRTGGTPLDWMDGWVFFCRDHNSHVDPSTYGRFSFCQVKDGPAVMASIKRGYREQTYNLTGPYSLQNAVLEWATPVIWTRN